MSLEITVGADPEFFLKTSDGIVTSAIGRVGGSKLFPKSLGRDGFAVQEDNVALEFNIPPARTAEDFLSSINWAISEIRDSVLRQGLSPSFVASALFDTRELESEAARVFGCDPDFNAWTDKKNPRPASSEATLRSCGGHIHVGVIGTPSTMKRSTIIKAMDLYLGVPSVLMDLDQRRRELYGKAGAYRPTSYGVEYRVLSNFWLTSNDRIKWAFEQTKRAVEAAVCSVPEYWERLRSDIMTAINAPNYDLANSLCEKYNLETC